MSDYEFTVVIDQDEDGRFVAIYPSLQGCYTEGESEDGARELIEDAIRLSSIISTASGDAESQSYSYCSPICGV